MGIDITVTCNEVSKMTFGNYNSTLDLVGVDEIKVEKRELSDLIEMIGIDNVLDAISELLSDKEIMDHLDIDPSEYCDCQQD